MTSLVTLDAAPAVTLLSPARTERTVEALKLVLEKVGTLKLQPLALAKAGLSDGIFRAFLEAQHTQEGGKAALQRLIEERLQLAGKVNKGLHADANATQNPGRCLDDSENLIQCEAWIGLALARLKACQQLPELPQLSHKRQAKSLSLNFQQLAADAEAAQQLELDLGHQLKGLKAQAAQEAESAAHELIAARAEQHRLREELSVSFHKAAASRAGSSAAAAAAAGSAGVQERIACAGLSQQCVALDEQLLTHRAAHQAEMQHWQLESTQLTKQRDAWAAKRQASGGQHEAKQAHLDACLHTEHATEQELTAQIQQELALQAEAECQSAQAALELRRYWAARRIQAAWRSLKVARAAALAAAKKKKPKKGKKGATGAAAGKAAPKKAAAAKPAPKRPATSGKK